MNHRIQQEQTEITEGSGASKNGMYFIMHGATVAATFKF
jgi:hypothetical protein